MFRLRTLVLLFGDFLLLAASYFAAYLVVRSPVEWFEVEEFLLAERGLPAILVLIATILFAMYILGLYQNIRTRSRRALAEDLTLVFGVCFLLQAFFSFARGSFVLSRSISLTGALLAFGIIILWRSAYTNWLLRVSGLQKVLFWGDTRVARELAHHLLQFPEKGFGVAGLVRTEDHSTMEGEFPSPVILHPGPTLLEQVRELNPDRVCVSGQIAPEDSLGEALLQLSMHGVTVESVGDLHELVLQRVCLETITLNQLIFSPQFRPARWKILCQDAYGVIFSVVGILLTWPFMILTAIAVRLDSPGPALLRQRRVGRNGEIFEILKFRSMYIDGDARFGAIRADKNDPRITRVGRFIRITRLDELPQFFNVLRGEMAFVGPRPEMPVHTERITQGIPLYPQRLRVKPGITGWAQLFHVPELTLVETRRKVEYDLYYIKNMSPLMDFLIIFHTLRTLIHRTGAR
jgi:exopolysaccharide biosynthesis polyprenyl glycosylphosphotransferase